MAAAIVAAVVWVICSILVVAIPGPMMNMSGRMPHADFGDAGWTLGWGGFILGLVLWSVLSGLIIWAVAAVYNSLVD